MLREHFTKLILQQWGMVIKLQLHTSESMIVNPMINLMLGGILTWRALKSAVCLEISCRILIFYVIVPAPFT